MWRSISSLSAATLTRLRRGGACLRACVPNTQQARAPAARAFRVGGRAGRPPRSPIHTASQRCLLSCAARSRALFGLAENPGEWVKVPLLGGGISAPRSISSLEALVAALALPGAPAPVKLALTMDEAVHRHHQASPRRSASKSAVTRDGKAPRARQCDGFFWNGGALCEPNRAAAGNPEVGFHGVRALRHRHNVKIDSLRALHQPAACRRAARLRHSAALVWAYESHTPT